MGISRDGLTLSIEETDRLNSHTEELTILIERCVKKVGITFKDLGAVAISHGPGSYTSLRVGASTAKGLCFGLDIPLIAIDSLKILAVGIGQIEHGEVIAPMIDARRMEVYTCFYDKELTPKSNLQSLIIDDQSFLQLMDTYKLVHLCGSGAKKCMDFLSSDKLRLHHLVTSARYMSMLAFENYKIARFENVSDYKPEYLKSPNISKSTKKFL